MTIQHHPDEATLMSYAAGTLSEPLSVVVASHLELCPHCRARARQLEIVGAAILEDVAPADMAETSLDAFWQKLDALDDKVLRLHPERVNRRPAGSEGGLSGPLATLLGHSLAEVPWKRLAPGIRYYSLPLSDPSRGDLRLLKIAPGRKMPEHGHGGSEMTLVLSGSYQDRFGRFGPGDVADLDEDVEHQPIVDAGQECICLVASEHPARFKGLLSRLLQPLIGM